MRASSFLLFAVQFLLYSFPSAAALNPPNLQSPSTGAIMKSFEAFLSVSTVNGAKGYQFQYDTVSTFNSGALSTDTTEPNRTFIYTRTLRKGRTYYWRARAYAPGDTSGWSSTNNFKVTTAMELFSPADNTTGPMTLLNPNSAGSFIKVTYLFEVDTVAALNSSARIFVAQNARGLLDSNFFDFGKKMFWRATAINEFNDTLTWSSVRSYTVYTQPLANTQGSSAKDPQVVLSWPLAGAAELRLQLDTVRDFSSSGLVQKIFPANSMRDTLRELLFGKRYYFRIQAFLGKKNSEWSKIDSFTIKAVPTGMTPANNTTTPNLVVSLVWSNSIGSRSQVQFSKDSLFAFKTLDTVISGNNIPLADTLDLNTRYFWRVRYFHDKDSSQWSAVGFRTFTGQLNHFLPTSDSKDLNVRISFIFRNAAWANGYILEIDTGKSFGNVLSGHGLRINKFSTYQVNFNKVDTLLRYGRNYVYRVYAIRGNDTSEASFPFTFTTKAAPIPNFPNNNFIGIGTRTVALVSGIEGSINMQWELDTSMDFNSQALLKGVAPHKPDDITPQYVGVELPGDLLFEAKYFWRTRCLSAIDTSKWSVVFNFTTTQVPWLNEPTDKAVNVSISPRLKWGVQGSAMDYVYQYQISTDSNFIGTAIKSLVKGSSAEATETCTYATTYYWRARAFHSLDTSSWSPIGRFTTQAQPSLAKTSLSSPANGAKNLPEGVVSLFWFSVTNATTYDIEVAADAGFLNLLATNNTANTGISFNGFLANRTYYWHVRARLGAVKGPWSNTWSFETVKTSTDINETINTPFELFPNPAYDVLKLRGKDLLSIKMTDLRGRLVLESQLSNIGDDVQIDISTFPKGLYLVQIETLSGAYSTKVVIQR